MEEAALGVKQPRYNHQTEVAMQEAQYIAGKIQSKVTVTVEELFKDLRMANNMYKLIIPNLKKDVNVLKAWTKSPKLQKVLTQLINNQSLDPKHRDHALTGNYIGFRECHIETRLYAFW